MRSLKLKRKMKSLTFRPFSISKRYTRISDNQSKKSLVVPSSEQIWVWTLRFRHEFLILQSQLVLVDLQSERHNLSAVTRPVMRPSPSHYTCAKISLQILDRNLECSEIISFQLKQYVSILYSKAWLPIENQKKQNFVSSH